jgi:type III restriction enzyme
VILDSEWEGEFCRVVESHPKVFSYVKNQALGFDVPYQFGGISKRYVPDFIALIDDGRGADDLLRLVIEIKGYRGEDAKAKKDAMDTFWIPGVNALGTFGRWAFAEFTDVFSIQDDFDKLVNEVTDRG